jgi:transcriptional regulator with GAF, ATPase, and Fis domain
MVDRFLDVPSARKLDDLLGRLDSPDSPPQLYIPGTLHGKSHGGQPFAAEGTISRFALGGRDLATLVLRNINDRLEAEAALRKLSDQREYLRGEVDEPFAEIIGRSVPMQRLLREVEEVARTDATVLVAGETGTGKELVARAIHRGSRRAEKPLIKLNCAAIPSQLVESEFFGHEKGAFTGALGKREGRFALADGGTLFLDEIGELPLDLQAKLLRVLQEGEFEPVGGSVTRKVDVRVIAATNRDLRKETEAGRFREDLYYRLSVFPVHVPALRARGRDIDLLAEAFARRFAAQHARPPLPLPPDQLERLRAYHWPGNVRELSNVIERATITGNPARLDPDSDGVAPPAANLTGAPTTTPQRVLTAAEIESIEQENLCRALAAANGRISGPQGAAALLGIPPTTLRSRMKALGITGR